MSDYSALQAIDFGLGQHLATIYSEGAIDGPADWQRLLKRPPASKIFRGDFETPAEIVQRIESGQKQSSTQSRLSINAPSLPLIAYGRKPNIQVIEPEAGDYQWDRTVTTDSGQTIKISMAMVRIEYRLMLMAWDKPTLDAMQLAWLFHVGNRARRGHKFDLAYNIDGEPLQDITAEIVDPKSVAFEDASKPRAEGRLHAVSMPVSIRAYAIAGAKVSVPDHIRWQFELIVSEGPRA